MCMIMASSTLCVAQTRRLYIGFDDYGVKAKQYFASQGAAYVTTIYGNAIYPSNPLLVDENTLSLAIVKAFPDANAGGYATMDFEGLAFDILAHKSASDSQYQAVLAQFQKALTVAKRVRPNVKWGFWGIPFRRIIFTDDQAWTDNNDKLAPLLQNIDVFFPSIYASYSLLGKFAEEGDLNGRSIYAKDVKESLRLAVKFNKPDLPFVWQRYEVNDEHRDKVIPPTQFKAIVNDIANTTYNGKKVNGMVLWSADVYFYAHKNKTISKEAPDMNTFKDQYDSTLVKYSGIMLNAMKK